MQQVADESGVSRHGADVLDLRHHRALVHPDRAPGTRSAAYPTLVDEGATVGLRVAASADEQEAHHRLGVRRLLLLALPSPVGALVGGLDNTAKLGLAASPYPNVRALIEDCVVAAAGELVDQAPVVRDEASFDALVATGRRRAARAVRGGAAPGAARAGRVATGREGAARAGRDEPAARR